MVIFLGFLAPADQRGKKTCMFFVFSPGEKETKRHVFCTKMWFGYVVSFKGKKPPGFNVGTGATTRNLFFFVGHQ